MQATQHVNSQLASQQSKLHVRAYITDNFMMGSQSKRLLDTDSFLENHVVDSTGFLELVTFLEERYGFAVQDDEMVPENLDSLNNIAAYVERKLEAHQATSLSA
jgi:acyl carrier protein